jgi:hypothetical protein
MRSIFASIALVSAAALASPAPAQCWQNGVLCVSGPSIADIVQFAQPTNAQTIQVAPNVSAIVLNPSGLLASLTVTLPANPVDGQRVIIASTAAITVLSVNGNGITVTGGLGSLTINGYERFIYSAALNAWVRSG